MRNCISVPCAKFCACFGLTAGSFIFGAIMLATGGASAPLAPFYCSLITGAVAYWATPPKVFEKIDEEKSLINN